VHPDVVVAEERGVRAELGHELAEARDGAAEDEELQAGALTEARSLGVVQEVRRDDAREQERAVGREREERARRAVDETCEEDGHALERELTQERRGEHERDPERARRAHEALGRSERDDEELREEERDADVLERVDLEDLGEALRRRLHQALDAQPWQVDPVADEEQEDVAPEATPQRWAPRQVLL